MTRNTVINCVLYSQCCQVYFQLARHHLINIIFTCLYNVTDHIRETAQRKIAQCDSLCGHGGAVYLTCIKYCIQVNLSDGWIQLMCWPLFLQRETHRVYFLSSVTPAEHEHPVFFSPFLTTVICSWWVSLLTFHSGFLKLFMETREYCVRHKCLKTWFYGHKRCWRLWSLLWKPAMCLW